MSKKKKETSIDQSEPKDVVAKTEEFSSFELEVESSNIEEILDKYKVIEKGRFFKDDKEFIVVTVISHNI